MDQAVTLFKALSDKNRFRILKMLEVKPLCVCEIAFILGLANSTTSKHLSILKEAELICEEKENKWVNYHLNRAAESALVRQIQLLMIQWANADAVVQSDRQRLIDADRYQLCNS